jgi:hypothetical protein
MDDEQTYDSNKQTQKKPIPLSEIQPASVFFEGFLQKMLCSGKAGRGMGLAATT